MLAFANWLVYRFLDFGLFHSLSDLIMSTAPISNRQLQDYAFISVCTYRRLWANYSIIDPWLLLQILRLGPFRHLFFFFFWFCFVCFVLFCFFFRFVGVSSVTICNEVILSTTLIVPSIASITVVQSLVLSFLALNELHVFPLFRWCLLLSLCMQLLYMLQHGFISNTRSFLSGSCARTSLYSVVFQLLDLPWNDPSLSYCELPPSYLHGHYLSACGLPATPSCCCCCQTRI